MRHIKYRDTNFSFSIIKKGCTTEDRVFRPALFDQAISVAILPTLNRQHRMLDTLDKIKYHTVQYFVDECQRHTTSF